MHRSGLLVLTNHASVLCCGDTVKQIVAGVKKLVHSTLYVHVENTSFIPPQQRSTFVPSLATNPKALNSTNSFSSDIFPFISKFYEETSHQCEDLDVNILLHNIGCRNQGKKILQRPVQCIITDLVYSTTQSSDSEIIRNFIKNRYILQGQDSNEATVPVFCLEHLGVASEFPKSGSITVTGKNDVVIGGTFDKIHPGHKVLLSEATLLANNRLLIGVTNGRMLERKTLHELIRPCEKRIKDIQKFLTDVHDFHIKDESIKNTANRSVLEVVSITDPIGPAATDPHLQCIVVSKETERGGAVVNDARAKNQLNQLEVHVIGGGLLIGDESSLPTNEVKMSSSTLRYKSLGVIRRPPNIRTFSHPRGAYVIGLTGGIASGKSSIAKRLLNLGAIVIDCDKLGHQAYRPGTLTFQKLVTQFGEDIISKTSGEIDRKVLGGKVFGKDPTNRNLLNSIVWPEIERLARKKIEEAVAMTSEKLVCVLDAAVLLEAGWDHFSDEVWVSIVTRDEAIKRVVERDGRTADDAERRIQSQISNHERVDKAHVVLSTMWEGSATQAQVEKAWIGLCQRLQPGWEFDANQQ